MLLSASQLVLRAKQLDTDAVKHLAARVELADVVGQLIHAVQRERGATSVYLASGGQRFEVERAQAMAQAQPIEAFVRGLFAQQASPEQGASARLLTQMAWVLLDLDALAALRLGVPARARTAHEAVATFSRVIAGLVELIFHVADAAPLPGISRLLVAFVHLVQGKETAGQERAVGAQLFASGALDETEQQRVIHLIDAQEHSLRVFDDFAEPALRSRWQQHQLAPHVAQLERLRRTLCSARASAALSTEMSELWFEVCSERITEMWQCQVELVQCLRQACAEQLQASLKDLQDSEGLLQHLRDNPPPHTHAVAQFFDAAAQPGAAPVLPTPGEGRAATQPMRDTASEQSLKALLESQQARMAGMEVELDAARRALHDRKVIERAKGALMSRLGMTEEAAYRALQKAAMDHNKRLLDVAEATLALPDQFFTGRAAQG